METSAGSRLVGGVVGVAGIVGGAVMTLRPFDVVAGLALAATSTAIPG